MARAPNKAAATVWENGVLGNLQNLDTSLPPDYIVMRAWKEVEGFLLQIATQLEILPSDQPPAKISVSAIFTIGKKLDLSGRDLKFMSDLFTLKQKVADKDIKSITIADALRYRDLAIDLIKYLIGALGR